jgi:RNA polymerase sigma-70 factor (ECF subfamily)
MGDAELVEAARTGDRTAFGSLVVRYRAEAFRLCIALTGNATDAEDLAHDAFVEAFLKLDQLRDAAKFGTWFRTLTLNVCRMWLRRTKPDDAAQHYLSDGLHEGAEEARADVHDGVMRLSPDHRVALVLHYWEGLSYGQMATFLGVPVGTDMSRLHRARAALRRVLEHPGEGAPMMPDNRFDEQISAEIGLLVQMFHKEPHAMERLSALLERSPGRLAQLVRESGDEALMATLARLVARLGRPAAEALLSCFLVGAPAAAERATCLLRHWRDASYNLPATEMYLLLDGLLQSSDCDARKSQLLIEWMDAARDDRTVNLIADVLMTLPAAAFALLMDRFWAGQASRRVVHALCRSRARTKRWS